MIFVKRKLSAVDPRAETEIGGQDGETARDYTGDNSRNIRAVVVVGRRAVDQGRAGLRGNRSVGTGDGIGDWFTRCQGTLGCRLSWGRDGRSAAAVTTDDRLDGTRDLIAITTAKTGRIALLGYLLVLGIASFQSGELILPCKIGG